jgi:hypothetical protein
MLKVTPVVRVRAAKGCVPGPMDPVLGRAARESGAATERGESERRRARRGERARAIRGGEAVGGAVEFTGR